MSEFGEGFKYDIQINRTFLNYLASVLTLTDHTKSGLNRKYGSKSKELASFEAYLTSLFDSKFEYRFFYKLRNYAQHIELPFQGNIIQYDSQKQHPGQIIKVNVELDTKRLLANYQWGAVLHPELELLPPKLDILPLIKVHFNLVQGIYQHIKGLKSQQRDLAIKFMRELTSTKNDDYSKDYVLVVDETKVEKKLNLSLEFIPLNRIKYIE